MPRTPRCAQGTPVCPMFRAHHAANNPSPPSPKRARPHRKAQGRDRRRWKASAGGASINLAGSRDVLHGMGPKIQCGFKPMRSVAPERLLKATVCSSLWKEEVMNDLPDPTERCSDRIRDYEGRGTDLADETYAAIVPVAAGSTTDIVPRAVFEQLSLQLGQPIVVENEAAPGDDRYRPSNSRPSRIPMVTPSRLRVRAHDLTFALFEPELPPSARFCRGRPAPGISPGVLVVSPAKGFKTVGDLVAAGKPSRVRSTSLRSASAPQPT